MTEPTAFPAADPAADRAAVVPQVRSAEPRLVTGTIPYAWPWDGALEGRRLALVLAGSDPGWQRTTPLEDAAAHRLVLAIAAVRGASGIVVHVSHPAARTRGPAGNRDVPATGDGTADRVDPTIDARDDRDLTVSAAGLDGFYGSPLDAVLRAEGRDQLVLAGWGLEGPVHSTMRTANDQGYECLLLTDAVSAITSGTRDPALSIVTMSGGIFGALGTTDALCAALAASPTDSPHDSPPDSPPGPSPHSPPDSSPIGSMAASSAP